MALLHIMYSLCRISAKAMQDIQFRLATKERLMQCNVQRVNVYSREEELLEYWRTREFGIKKYTIEKVLEAPPTIL